MKLGTFEIPEFRLVPNCVEDIRKIYDTVKLEKITSKDLAPLLGYKAPTSGRFYVKLHSLVTYGLIKSGNNVTELGYEIAYPESPDHEDTVRKKAIFNVRLWKELYDRVGVNPPADFWIPLGNITKEDSPTAQKHSSLIKKWYMEDISLLPERILQNPLYDDTKESKTETIRSGLTQDKPRLQSDTQTITFANKFSISLPKGDLEKEYEKFDKYMKLYLEDYKEEQQKSIENKKFNAGVEYAKCPNCGLVAHNSDEVKTLFGFRTHNGKQILQSWCVDCRRTGKMIN